MTGNVLALSGGGYRGLFTVRVLRLLEEHTGKPLTNHFDLIAGTSIGGIIALGIAAGIPLAKIEEKFIEKGPSVFPKPIEPTNKAYFWLHRIRKAIRMFFAVFRPIHKPDGLKELLEELFQDKRMEDLDKAYVVVTSSNVTTGAPKMFKTPHHEKIYLDAKLRVVDVALATSAAPSYFPIHEMDLVPNDQVGDDAETNQTNENRGQRTKKGSLTTSFFTDGALMGNAPGLFGWLEAHTRLGAKLEDITVLSIGTLGGKPNVSGGTKLNKGAWFWLNPVKLRLLNFFIAQQEQTTNYMLNLLLGNRYHLIDDIVSAEAASDIDLDDTSPAATRTLAAQADKHFADFTGTDFYNTHFPRPEDN